jgi:hypothetical protein
MIVVDRTKLLRRSRRILSLDVVTRQARPTQIRGPAPPRSVIRHIYGSHVL